MLLKDKQRDVLVEILNPEALFDPSEATISGQVQSGEEEQDPEPARKEDLIFPSGEALPRCWLEVDYSRS